ncbi:MAG: SH3 domain-containing protein [Gemmatimonadota bacterium]
MSSLLVLALCAGTARLLPQEARTTERVRLRAGPTLDDSILKVLAKNAHVSLLSTEVAAAGFFHVALPSGDEGWVHGHYLVLSDPDEPALDFHPADGSTGHPLCGGEKYYRWAAKVDHSDVTEPPTHTTVTTMLGWPGAEIGRDLGSLCADRGGRELRAYEVTGWVRRVKKHEEDGDWHIEFTATKSAAVGNCIIAEIPDPEHGGEYADARAALEVLLDASNLASNGDVTPAVRVRFVGAAFYDGWHRNSNDHGRCNSSPGARWELHPVFTVTEP